MTPQPGFYRDIPYDTYASWDALRSSVLKKIDSDEDAPARVQLELATPRAATPALLMGQLLEHYLGLEHHDIAIGRGCEAVMKSGKRAGQSCGNTAAPYSGEWLCGVHEKSREPDVLEYATEEAHEAGRQMATSIMTHEHAAELIRGCKRQPSALAMIDGSLCKSRPDGLHPSGIVSLKSALSASPILFEKQARQLR